MFQQQRMSKKDFDAVVVGAGPNGLAAAIVLQQEGLSVLVLEAKSAIGGGMRSAELTLPGFMHDVCSAVHPMAAGSPFFRSLPLDKHGLEFIYPDIAAAHPLDNGTAAVLLNSLEKTAGQSKQDERSYLNLFQPLLKDWSNIEPAILGPLKITSHPAALARFGINALLPASVLARRTFKTDSMQALFGGMAAHSIQPLSRFATAAIGLVLMTEGHIHGWPIPKGGSQQIANALASCFQSMGGKIMVNTPISSLKQLPSCSAVLFDVTPRQLLKIAGHKLSSLYKWQLNRYKYGMGTFKIDWALDAPVPFSAPDCNNAGTVHIGNTLREIETAEQMTHEGKHPEKPFVLLAQQSRFDPSRAPEGKHTLWAYCHVPNGSRVNMTDAIEKQIERFAPGFRERILARHVMDTEKMEAYNANYIGGDINGGEQNLSQMFTRPALRFSPYRTSAKGMYICSSSTPPGGGVHGMCGYHAARRALKDIFKIEIAPL